MHTLDSMVDRLNKEHPVRWIVRWSIVSGENIKNFAEGFEFHISAVDKQLTLQEFGVESIIECAR